MTSPAPLIAAAVRRAAAGRDTAYLNHALATGRYPQLAYLLTPASPAQISPAPEAAAEPTDRYRDILARILTGLLTAS